MTTQTHTTRSLNLLALFKAASSALEALLVQFLPSLFIPSKQTSKKRALALEEKVTHTRHPLSQGTASAQLTRPPQHRLKPKDQFNTRNTAIVVFCCVYEFVVLSFGPFCPLIRTKVHDYAILLGSLSPTQAIFPPLHLVIRCRLTHARAGLRPGRPKLRHCPRSAIRSLLITPRHTLGVQGIVLASRWIGPLNHVPSYGTQVNSHTHTHPHTSFYAAHGAYFLATCSCAERKGAISKISSK